MVVLKFTAWSDISYKYEYDTEYTEEEWNSLSLREQTEFINEALWNDIEVEW